MKSKKTWLLLSLSCFLLGTLLSTAGIMLGGIPGFYLDKTGVHSSRESAEHAAEVFQDTLELTAFDSMELNVHYADVILVPSDRYAVEYRITGASETPSCQVENGRLTFEDGPLQNDPRIWFFYTAPNSSYAREPEPGPYYVKVEFPADHAFSDVSIRMESGDLKLPDLRSDTLQITNQYGDVSLNDFTGQEFSLSMSSGDFSAGTLEAGSAKLRNEYGDLTVQAYTGDDLSLDTSSSYLSLGTIQAKQFHIRNDYGDILVNEASGDDFTVDQDSGSFLADRLDYTSTRIENEYGNVHIQLPDDPAAYGYDLHTEYGFIRLDGRSISSGDDDNEVSYRSDGAGEKTVKIFCENGDIVVEGL